MSGKKITFFAILLLLIITAGLLSFVSYKKYNTVRQHLSDALINKNALEKSLKELDIVSAKKAIEKEWIVLGQLRGDTEFLQRANFIPAVKEELDTASLTFNKAEYLLKVAELAVKMVESSGVNNLPASSNAYQGEVLKKIQTAVAQNTIALQQLQKEGLTVRKKTTTKIVSVAKANESMDEAIEATVQALDLVNASKDGLFSFLGFGKEKKYLVLFQNSQDLRPGGGLISTYGILKVRDGEVVDMEVNHVTSLRNMYIEPREANPEPIRKYVRSTAQLIWYDSNWLIIPEEWLGRMLNSWNRQQQPVDGVLAVGTSFLEDLVRQYEPLKLRGYNEEFHAHDVVGTLDYILEKKEARVNGEIQYHILKILVDDLLAKVTATPPNKLKPILDIVNKRMASRDIMVYTPNAMETKSLNLLGMQTKIPSVNEDEIFIVDSGLASGKADASMKRTVEIKISADKEKPEGEAKMKYDFTNSKRDFRTFSYNGFVRFGLPIGTVGVNMEGGDIALPYRVVEAGRQIFGNFYSVNIGGTKDVSLRYILPDHIVKGIQIGGYQMTLRKQPGVEDKFVFMFYPPEGWQNARMFVTLGKVTYNAKEKAFIWEGTLTKDATITLDR